MITEHDKLRMTESGRLHLEEQSVIVDITECISKLQNESGMPTREIARQARCPLEEIRKMLDGYDMPLSMYTRVLHVFGMTLQVVKKSDAKI